MNTHAFLNVLRSFRINQAGVTRFVRKYYVLMQVQGVKRTIRGNSNMQNPLLRSHFRGLLRVQKIIPALNVKHLIHYSISIQWIGCLTFSAGVLFCTLQSPSKSKFEIGQIVQFGPAFRPVGEICVAPKRDSLSTSQGWLPKWRANNASGTDKRNCFLRYLPTCASVTKVTVQ